MPDARPSNSAFPGRSSPTSRFTRHRSRQCTAAPSRGRSLVDLCSSWSPRADGPASSSMRANCRAPTADQRSGAAAATNSRVRIALPRGIDDLNGLGIPWIENSFARSESNAPSATRSSKCPSDSKFGSNCTGSRPEVAWRVSRIDLAGNVLDPATLAHASTVAQCSINASNGSMSPSSMPLASIRAWQSTKQRTRGAIRKELMVARNRRFVVNSCAPAPLLKAEDLDRSRFLPNGSLRPMTVEPAPGNIRSGRCGAASPTTK